MCHSDAGGARVMGTVPIGVKKNQAWMKFCRDHIIQGEGLQTALTERANAACQVRPQGL